MGFSDVLESIGGVGRFQVWQMIFLLISVCLIGCHNFLQNFTAAVLDHYCQPLIPTNQSILGNLTKSAEEGILLKASVPLDRNQKPERCLQFATTQWLRSRPRATELANATEMRTQPCAGGWMYSTEVFESTIVTEWDLVCDRQTWRDVAQSLYMAAVLGVLSDRFGRRLPLVWSYLQVALASSSTAFLPNFASYCAFRFLAGMTFSGIMLNSFSLSKCCLGGHSGMWIQILLTGRTVAGTLVGYIVTFGQIVLAGVAYAIRNWRWLQLAVSAPFFIVFLCSWKLPESPCWLLLHRKTPAAVQNLKKLAVINGKREEGEKITQEVLNVHMQMDALKPQSSHTVLVLFRTPALRRVTCCLMVVWFSSSFSYYGLAMDVQKFGLNIYVVQAVFGVMDLPAVVLSTLTMNVAGRRLTMAASLALAGLMVLLNLVVPEDLQALRTAQAALGKGCLASSFIGAYLYSGELYPTEIRQTGLGFVSMQARLGAMAAPLVYVLRNSFPLLPPVIFAAAPLLAGITTCFLAETRHAPLLETIAEMEHRARKLPPRNTDEEMSLRQMEMSHFNESV